MAVIILTMIAIGMSLAILSIFNYNNYTDELRWPRQESLVEWKDRDPDKEYEPVLINTIPSKTLWREVK